MEIMVGVSNRHVHLTKELLEKLFGNNYELTKKGDLKQPHQFSANETVTIKTPKSEIPNVRVLGPCREYNQIEISKTDAYKLGVNPPIRNSGDVKGSAPVTLVGPFGIVNLEEGCIIPNRHIHISYKELEEKGFKEEEIVSIRVEGIKGGVLDNVYLKPTEEAFFEIHLDTDDANAFLIKQNDIVKILK